MMQNYMVTGGMKGLIGYIFYLKKYITMIVILNLLLHQNILINTQKSKLLHLVDQVGVLMAIVKFG